MKLSIYYPYSSILNHNYSLIMSKQPNMQALNDEINYVWKIAEYM